MLFRSLHVDQNTDIIIADIPGIIEGASEGAGLGIKFLKHISRTAGLLFMIDCSDDNYLTAYETLCNELKNYSEDLVKKQKIILCNKIDIEGAAERAEEIVEQIKKQEPSAVVITVSVASRTNIEAARQAIIDLVEKMNMTHMPGKNHSGAVSPADEDEQSEFLASRSIDDSMEEQAPGSES